MTVDVHARDVVTLQEVAPRDGLQNEPVVFAPAVRAELINGLARAGLQWIQVGAFVNPAKVPQMAGTHLVWQLVDFKEAVNYTALVLNERGLDQALAAGIPIVEVYVSASEAHSRRNSNATVADSLAAAVRMIDRASSERVQVTAGVMCAFGCYYEGQVPVDRVKGLVGKLSEARPHSIALADSTGMGRPDDIRAVFHAIGDILPPARISLHLHDTHGRGFANMKTALELGVRRFDTSIGGLGGCPFIPGARGNISTAAAVKFVESLGFRTGVDQRQLASVRTRMEVLLGRPLV